MRDSPFLVEPRRTAALLLWSWSVASSSIPIASPLGSQPFSLPNKSNEALSSVEVVLPSDFAFDNSAPPQPNSSLQQPHNRCERRTAQHRALTHSLTHSLTHTCAVISLLYLGPVVTAAFDWPRSLSCLPALRPSCSRPATPPRPTHTAAAQCAAAMAATRRWCVRCWKSCQPPCSPHARSS